MNTKHGREAILKACDIIGGQHAMKRVLGLKSQGTVAYWVKIGRVPPKWVLKIERITGVTRHELRPDLYPEDVGEVVRSLH